MSNGFLNTLYYFIADPKQFVVNRIKQIEQKDPTFLTFSFYFIIIVACCDYIGFVTSTGLTDFISSSHYVFFMALTVILCFIIIFLESAVTSFFLQNRNVTPYPFGSKQVFLIVSLSYVPFIFVPAVSIFSILLDPSLYFLFIIVALITVLVIRKKHLDQFKQFFNAPTWLLAILPFVITLMTAFLFLIFIFSITGILASQAMKGLF